MVDQRRQIIDEIHKLNILLIHTKLKTTRARTVARATTHVRNVDAARRGTVPRPKPSKPIEADVHMLDCLNDEELSTLGELLQRIIDNTDTKLLDEEISERRKAIHEFLMLNHTDEEVREHDSGADDPDLIRLNKRSLFTPSASVAVEQHSAVPHVSRSTYGTAKVEGRLTSPNARVPEIITQRCGGITVKGHTLKSFAYTTDAVIIRNTNANAILAAAMR